MAAMIHKRSLHSRAWAFTLLELLLVILIIAALASIILPAYQTTRVRAEGVSCRANLRSLHTGFELYLQEHNRTWPQPPTVSSLDMEADWWVELLAPYGPNPDTWLCPSRKRESGQAAPGFLPNSIDYLPALFDELPGTPYKWSGQPWLIEVGNYHGNGNLVLFPDGHIETSSGVSVSGS